MNNERLLSYQFSHAMTDEELEGISAAGIKTYSTPGTTANGRDSCLDIGVE